MEAKKNFAEVSTSGSQEKSTGHNEEQDVEPSLLATFLKTFMKFICDKKEVEGLQELVDKCVDRIKFHLEQCAVRKLSKHKKRTGREMRLTAQIGEYEMDQVILDLGSDVNVLLKKTWERMGRPMVQWSASSS